MFSMISICLSCASVANVIAYEDSYGFKKTNNICKEYTLKTVVFLWRCAEIVIKIYLLVY